MNLHEISLNRIQKHMKAYIRPREIDNVFPKAWALTLVLVSFLKPRVTHAFRPLVESSSLKIRTCDICFLPAKKLDFGKSAHVTHVSCPLNNLVLPYMLVSFEQHSWKDPRASKGLVKKIWHLLPGNLVLASMWSNIDDAFVCLRRKKPHLGECVRNMCYCCGKFESPRPGWLSQGHT